MTSSAASVSAAASRSAIFSTTLSITSSASTELSSAATGAASSLSSGISSIDTSSIGPRPESTRSMISISCGSLTPGRMMRTVQPTVPSFLTAVEKPSSMNCRAVSPQNLMWPCWNFCTRWRAPEILPLRMIRHPRAPASMMFCAVLWPARRKNQPRSSEEARRLAMTCAFSRGSSISLTSSRGFSSLKSLFRRCCNSWMTLPLRPMTRPTCSADRVTFVPSGVRLNSSPPNPARSVSRRRYSRTS